MEDEQIAVLTEVLSARLPADLTQYMVRRIKYYTVASPISRILSGYALDVYFVDINRICAAPTRRLYYMLTSPSILRLDPRMSRYETRSIISYSANRLLIIGLMYAVSLSRMIESAIDIDYESSSESEYLPDEPMEDDDTI